MIQDTSLLAYAEVLENLGERQMQVYKAISELGECSNTMIAEKLNLPISSITPRVNELRKKKAVRESHRDHCPITGRKVIFWKVSHKLV
jgi:DNA-binding MarR family transcriptional regulator